MILSRKNKRISILTLVLLFIVAVPIFAGYGDFGLRTAVGFGFGDQIGIDGIDLGLGFDEIGGLDLSVGSFFGLPYQFVNIGAVFDLYPFKNLVIENRVQSFFLRGKYQYTAYGVGLGFRGILEDNYSIQFVAGYSLVRTHKKIVAPYGFFFELSFTKFFPFNEAIE